MNRRELFGAALAGGAVAATGIAANASPVREPDGWMMVSTNYQRIIPDGELERWKFNWKPLLLDGRAVIVPLYKGDAVPKENLTFKTFEEVIYSS